MLPQAKRIDTANETPLQCSRSVTLNPEAVVDVYVICVRVVRGISLRADDGHVSPPCSRTHAVRIVEVRHVFRSNGEVVQYDLKWRGQVPLKVDLSDLAAQEHATPDAFLDTRTIGWIREGELGLALFGIVSTCICTSSTTPPDRSEGKVIPWRSQLLPSRALSPHVFRLSRGHAVLRSRILDVIGNRSQISPLLLVFVFRTSQNLLHSRSTDRVSVVQREVSPIGDVKYLENLVE